MGFCSVLNHGETVFLGEFEQRVHVNRVPVDVDRHDGPSPRRDPRRHLRHIHAPGLRVAIDQNGHRALIHGRRGTRDDRERRHDDFVAGPKVQGRNCELQGNGPIADGDAVSPAAVGGPVLLEPSDEPPGRGDPACPQTFGDVLELTAVETWLVYGDHSGLGSPEGSNRSFSAWPLYGPCLTSRRTVPSSMRKPCPPLSERTRSPASSSREVTRARSSS